MVDDIIFSMFVNNLLPQNEMKKVEEQLRNDRELGASYAASMLNYQLNKEYADDILGTDYEFSEKNIEQEAGITAKDDSLLVDDHKKSKSTTMKTTISSNEALKIHNLAVELDKYREQHDSISHQEVLASFYRLHMGDDKVSEEEAQEVIAAVTDGVLDFNKNLNEAYKADGFNYKERLTEVLKDSSLSNEQKYEILANFYAAIKYLNVENVNKKTGSAINAFNPVELSPDEEISEEQLSEMVDTISEELENSNIFMTSPDTIKDIYEMSVSSPSDMDQFVLGSEFDIKEKVRAAVITYILYRKGELESFKPDGDTEFGPKEIGAFVAAGIEEAKVASDLAYKKITEKEAYKKFKTISGAIIFTAITLSLLAVGAMLTIIGFLHIATYVASASLAVILAMALGFLIITPLVKLGMDEGEKLVNWMGRTLDRIVDFIQRKCHTDGKKAEEPVKDTETAQTATEIIEESEIEEVPDEIIEDAEVEDADFDEEEPEAETEKA